MRKRGAVRRIRKAVHAIRGDHYKLQRVLNIVTSALLSNSNPKTTI